MRYCRNAHIPTPKHCSVYVRHKTKKKVKNVFNSISDVERKNLEKMFEFEDINSSRKYFVWLYNFTHSPRFHLKSSRVVWNVCASPDWHSRISAYTWMGWDDLELKLKYLQSLQLLHPMHLSLFGICEEFSCIAAESMRNMKCEIWYFYVARRIEKKKFIFHSAITII